MSNGWMLVGDLVKLLDETDTVRVGPGSPALSAPPRLEVVGNARLTLQDKGGNVYDVKAYGAKGDGVADDLPRINDAVAALRAGGGGTLYFPPGHYVVSNEIVIDGYLPSPPTAIPFLVRGAGPQATMLLSGSTTANTIRTTYGGATALGSRQIFMEIRDLMFGVVAGIGVKTAGDAIRQECAPEFQNTFLVRNCWFRDVYNAVHLTSIGSAVIADCSFVDPKNAAVFLESSTPSGDVGTVNIADNLFFRLATGVYGVHATTGASGIRIHNNIFIRYDHQVLFELGENSLHTAVNIDSNLFDGQTRHSKIQITGFGRLHRWSISNNQITCWQLDAGSPIAGILVDVGVQGASAGNVHSGSITGNTFDGKASETISKGIALGPTNLAASCHDVLVSGNVFGNLATGIEIGANAHRIYVSENVFEPGTVTTPMADGSADTRGAFFPDRVGVGRPNDVTPPKEIYACSSQAARPRVYLQGLAGASSPGIEFAFDNANTRRAAIVATAPAGQNNLGVQLELFTKPDSGAGITQRAVLDAAGNLVWTSANYQEMMELGADPAAPAAHKARLFLRDDGSGRTQLCVRFATGPVVVLAGQT